MPKASLTFEAIGTTWSIETKGQLAPALLAKIHQRIETFDSVYSRFRTDSLVAKIAGAPGIYAFPADAHKIFAFYLQLYRLTKGKVTLLIGSALENAGYDKDYSITSKKQLAIPAMDKVLHVNGSIVEVARPVVLDFGAAGKGALVDNIAQLLQAEGIEEYVIDASGDMCHKGSDEQRVGLEDPRDTSKVIGVIDIKNRSLCASAVNRRRWGQGMHHIFDPHTKAPTNEIIATWVIADSTMIADGLATALFFSDPATLATAFSYEFVRMHASGAIDYSTAFEGNLF